MKAALVAPCILALTGCAHHNMMWVKEGATQADFERDRSQCIYESAAATGSYNPSGATARTYSGAIAQGIGDGIAIGLRRAEIAVLCMQARGYRQVPIGTAGVTPAAAPPYSAPDPRESMNRPVTPEPPHTVLVGRWSYNVERTAREEKCHDTPVARLASDVGDAEMYSVRCADGSTLMLRCDSGNCRVLK